MSTETIETLLGIIHQEIISGKLVLPTLPDVGHRIRQEMAEGASSVDKIAEIVAEDVATATRLIKVANSALFGSVRVSTTRDAVFRLGNVKTGQLVDSFLVEQLFRSSQAHYSDFLRKVWSQSVSVAAMARAFALFAPHLNPDAAMLAGLIHQVGKLPVLTFFSQRENLSGMPKLLEQVAEQAHCQLGELLLQAWCFPVELIDVSRDYLNFDRRSHGPADYVDVVQVAFLQIMAGSDHPSGDCDWSNVAAFAKLGIVPGNDVLGEPKVQEQIDWVLTTFNGGS